MEKSEMGKSGEGFIDRSKVRILLCDNDEKSSGEVVSLLCKCSYQVTSVKSPRQVIDALNAEGADIDIILSEVDLPMSKGLKMLKYIMRDKKLRPIPVIMMSAQDEVAIVVKCLKFGAADYLVKPLRTNELLNLWTHMWRRRRMLGLVEKNIISYGIDLVASDHSDANTNSTTLFSDDTNDKSQKSNNPEMCVSTHQEDGTNATAAAPLAIATGSPSEHQPDVRGISDRGTGEMASFPKKSALKIGESSAFFMYTKTSTSRNNHQGASSVQENTLQHSRIVENPILSSQLGSNTQGQDSREALEYHSEVDDNPSANRIPESFSTDRSCTPPLSHQKNSKEFSHEHMHLRNDSPNHVTGCYPQTAYPFYMSGVMNHQLTMSSASIYHKNIPDMHNHASSALLPQYNHIPQCPQIPGMTSYPCYPFSMCLQPVPWPSFETPSSNEAKVTKVDRREAALIKFRQKRKERCFDKKIRYVNRKKLAERRPRLRGQFARQVNGIDVDLNGQPASADNDEDGEYYEDQAADTDVSPEDDTSEYQPS